MKRLVVILAAVLLSVTPAFSLSREQVNTDGAQTLSNKSVSLGSNTLTGTLAQFNTALTGADFASLDGIESMSHKTLVAAIFSGTFTGTYTLGGTLTITSPSITTPSITTPTLTGTVSGTYVLAAPQFSGTVTGTYNLGGTPTITAPVLSGSVTGTATLAGTITVPGTLTAGTSAVRNPFATSVKTTQAHGLGVVPALVVSYAECLTTERGYSVGDRIYLPAALSSGYGWIVEADATNVNIITESSGLRLIDKTTPASNVAATVANWKIVAVPYRMN